jgi:hypothetical protein
VLTANTTVIMRVRAREMVLIVYNWYFIAYNGLGGFETHIYNTLIWGQRWQERGVLGGFVQLRVVRNRKFFFSVVCHSSQ